MELSSLLELETDLIFIDQEKTLHRVEHKYMGQAMGAFVFNPDFIAMMQLLYCDVKNFLKINGSLSAHFNVQRGVR